MKKTNGCLGAFALLAGLALAGDFPAFSAPRAMTSGPKDHLFASYYAINAWSADGRYATVLETEVKNRLPTEQDAAVLGVVDAQDNNRFIPLTETRCWNFQEAAMAHWLGTAPRTQFIFNDLVDGRFVSVIFDMANRTRRVVPFPVSAVSRDGRWAVSINYARLRLTRPDYGYGGNGQNARADTVWPEDDGLWLVDLASGEARLIVTIASVRDRMPAVKDPKALAYFCHTVFSRDGSKIFWLARTVENLVGQKVVRKWETTSFTCNRDGSGVRRCFPDGWGGSHFNWLDGDRLMVTAKFKDAVWSHVLFTPGKEDYTRLGRGLLDFDGHGVFSDDGRWMATDTYPDKLGERKLMVMRMADHAVLPLGAFFVPELYREQYSRCDLHPRWRPDGKMLAFNSVHEGSRQVYVVDVTAK
ncbi:MAG TPA: hypothetical protein PLU38_03505 [Kiritimatiellia bacterium]|nr:hypothetical protein [Kiritimatiellia bacterium]HPO36847.1 hypothetical protein [Kiritimatiellia bacterium]HQQ90911.1 hypothetical protein [Kiritimatiellia bacterium]